MIGPKTRLISHQEANHNLSHANLQLIINKIINAQIKPYATNKKKKA